MLYEDVLTLCPPHWEKMEYTTRYSIVALEKYSLEYQKCKHLFQSRENAEIFRIQNPLLYSKFVHKKHELEQLGPVSVLTLFLDTSQQFLDNIASTNFDWRLIGEPSIYGPGIYFYKWPEEAVLRSNKDNGPLRALFAVDVLVQNVFVADGEIFLPPHGYDTVVTSDGKTYIKYFDCEYYPALFMPYEAGFYNVQTNYLYSNGPKVVNFDTDFYIG